MPAARATTTGSSRRSAAELRGTLLYPATGGADGTNGDVLLLGPPFVITEEQIDRVAATVRDALDAVVS